MKHMHLSKLLALALALACVLPLVIGCGGETGGKEEETTTAAVTTEVVTEPPEPVLEDRVYNLAEISDRIKHHGRTMVTSDGIRCDHTASGISFEAYISGPLSIEVDAMQETYFTIWVDGERLEERFAAHRKTTITTKDLGENALREIRILKQTEPQNSLTKLLTVSFFGELAGAAKDKEFYIEFIGDSITSGYGNLCVGGTSNPGAAVNSDGTDTYAFTAAELLGVDFSMISCSGIGIHRGYTNENGKGFNIDQFYRAESFYRDKNVAYNFEGKRVPDLVVVNLGTNDQSFVRQLPDYDTEEYVNGVKKFVAQVREAYGDPDLPIVWAYGMMGTAMSDYTKTAFQALGGEAAGLYIVELPKNSAGGGGHPFYIAQRKAGEQLANFIRDKGLLK